MVNILIGCTGSVATIKLSNLIASLSEALLMDNKTAKIQVVVTEHAKHFYDQSNIPNEIEIYTDQDEWNSWKNRGDPVLHIELGKWADLLLIAPLDANSLAKISNGVCDNLLLCTVRAWEMQKPLLFCPAMNTKMYNHPLTQIQISMLKSWGYLEITAIEKVLICGDSGLGAMAEVSTIVNTVLDIVRKSL